uniref:Uncharacterized protein n=1 Tax=Panagrolaimus sp. ES5 TaxID=591445 RepID=A0AC34FUE8_9BILA
MEAIKKNETEKCTKKCDNIKVVLKSTKVDIKNETSKPKVPTSSKVEQDPEMCRITRSSRDCGIDHNDYGKELGLKLGLLSLKTKDNYEGEKPAWKNKDSEEDDCSQERRLVDMDSEELDRLQERRLADMDSEEFDRLQERLQERRLVEAARNAGKKSSGADPGYILNKIPKQNAGDLPRGGNENQRKGNAGSDSDDSNRPLQPDGSQEVEMSSSSSSSSEKSRSNEQTLQKRKKTKSKKSNSSEGGAPAGGHRKTAAVKKNEVFMIAGPLWYEKADLMKKGHLKNKDHTINFNAHWRYIENGVAAAGKDSTTIRKRFPEARLNAIRKIQKMQQTGAAREPLTEFEQFIADMERNNEGVQGIETLDVGQVPVASRYPRRETKPHETFTFEDIPRRQRAVPVSPAVNEELGQSSLMAPQATPTPFNIQSPINSTDFNFTPTSSRSTTRKSNVSSSKPQRNIFDSVFDDSQNVMSKSKRQREQDEDSVKTISDDEIEKVPEKVTAKKSTPKKIDKPISLGKTPPSKNKLLIQDEIEKITNSVETSSALMAKEAESRMKAQASLLPKTEAMMSLAAEKLAAEKETALIKLKREKDEAELVEMKKRQAAIEIQKAEFELEMLKKKYHEEN